MRILNRSRDIVSKERLIELTKRRVRVENIRKRLRDQRYYEIWVAFRRRVKTILVIDIEFDQYKDTTSIANSKLDTVSDYLNTQGCYIISTTPNQSNSPNSYIMTITVAILR